MNRRFWPAFGGAVVGLVGVLAVFEQPVWVVVAVFSVALVFSLFVRLGRGGWCVALACGAVGLIATGATAWISAGRERPVVYTEAEIIRKAGDRGLVPTQSTRVANPLIASIRPDGPATAVFVFEPNSSESMASDQIEVYERTSAGFRLKFEFRPAPGPDHVAMFAGAPGARPEEAVTDGVGITLQPNPIDLDGHPGAELLLDLHESAFGVPIWPRPLVLSWNRELSTYDVTPLVSTASIRGADPGALLTHRFLAGPGDSARNLITYVYGEPNRLKNELSGAVYPSVFAAQAYVCTRETVPSAQGPSESGLLLTTGYVVRAPSVTAPEKLQVVRWHIRWDGKAPVAKAEYDSNDVIHIGSSVSRLDLLLGKVSPSGPSCTGPRDD